MPLAQQPLQAQYLGHVRLIRLAHRSATHRSVITRLHRDNVHYTKRRRLLGRGGSLRARLRQPPTRLMPRAPEFPTESARPGPRACATGRGRINQTRHTSLPLAVVLEIDNGQCRCAAEGCVADLVVPRSHSDGMTTTNSPRADGAGDRKPLHPAMQAALWTVSNGRRYAPGCPNPVVFEVRPGQFQKNSQIAHIYGVRPGAPRYRADLPAEIRDSFENLLLLCLAHHEEVDGKDGEKRYLPELLRKWKVQHEGADNAVLDRLRVLDTDALMSLLTQIAEPPVKRLEAIVGRLEETHTVTAETVAELKAIIAMMSDTGIGVDRATVEGLAHAAEVLNPSDLKAAAAGLQPRRGGVADSQPRRARHPADTQRTPIVHNG